MPAILCSTYIYVMSVKNSCEVGHTNTDPFFIVRLVEIARMFASGLSQDHQRCNQFRVAE